MRRLVPVFFLLTATDAHAQAGPPPDANVTFHISIVGGERPFRVGETIPIELAFSTAVSNRYQVNHASYDRSGRMEYEHFRVSPSRGSVDPLANRTLRGMSGGITGFSFLSAKPWTIRLNVNEWVRFTRPGTYQLEITSDRIEVKDPAAVRGTAPIIVVANPITLRIVPSTAAWRKDTLDRAISVLNQPVPATPPSDAYYQARSQALNTLRFLGSRDAIRELVNRLGESEIGNGDGICILGLISAPEPAVALAALEAALIDPDRPIDGRFLDAFRTVSSYPPDQARWRQDQQRALEKLVTALSKKRGRALAISLATAANEVWNFVSLPKSTADTLVQQLVAHFDQLPADQQSALLETRWDRFGSSELLTLLRIYALPLDSQLNPNSRSGESVRRRSAIALRRWYELDPAGARPAILAEITRPDPRYGARTLGLLPDKELPEVDAVLARNFVESNGETVRIASLIARYATGAALTPVLAKFDPKIGLLSCDIQESILAYALRVDPVRARPRIEQALAARARTGCYRQLLISVASMHYDPVLEDLAVRGLDDPDGDVVQASARVLGGYGASRVESLLLEHYRKWTEKWTGREAELNPAFADRGSQEIALREGAALLGALTTGKAWLTDATELQSLLSITKVVRLGQMLDSHLKTWGEAVPIIGINYRPGAEMEGRIAQYEFQSMQGLEDKLAQFPAHTTFALQVSGLDGQAVRTGEAQLITLLGERGMGIAPAR